MSSKRAIVAVTNDLTTDQRVAKVCDTLQELGYEITLVGRKRNHSASIQRSYKTKRFRLWFNSGPFFYANYSIRLYCYLLFRSFELLWSNDLDTLWPCFAVNKLKKKRLVFDSHEYFTEVPELVNRPKVQGFWKRIEQRILPKLSTVFTVSESIAQRYREEYAIDVHVLRNLPLLNKPITDAPDLRFNHQKIILYQGAINMGRGIELMVNAMHFCQGAVLYIIGSGDIVQQIQKQITDEQLQDKIFLLGEIPQELLAGYTQQADLGLSLEEDLGLNYRYALPNKLFNYIHASVPSIVSDLPEMKKLVQEYQVGEIAHSREPQQLGEQIHLLLNSPDKMLQFKQQCNKAASVLNWENEKNVILKLL